MDFNLFPSCSRPHIADKDYEALNDNEGTNDDQPFLLRGTASEITKSIKDYKKLSVSHIVLYPAVESLDDIFHTMEIVSRGIMPVINT